MQILFFLEMCVFVYSVFFLFFEIVSVFVTIATPPLFVMAIKSPKPLVNPILKSLIIAFVLLWLSNKGFFIRRSMLFGFWKFCENHGWNKMESFCQYLNQHDGIGKLIVPFVFGLCEIAHLRNKIL